MATSSNRRSMSVAMMLLALSAFSGVLVKAISSAELQRQGFFKQFDSNGDGQVSRAEFYNFAESVRDPSLASRSRLRAEFDNADKNGNNSLDIDELLPLPILLRMDSNDNGKVNFREYRQFLRANTPADAPFPSNEALRFNFDLVDADDDGKLTEAELNGYFNGIDTNRNQRINHREYRQFLQSFVPEGFGGPSEAETRAQFDSQDRNGDGTLSINEIFLPPTNPVAPIPVERAIPNREQAFAQFDTNGDGKVDVDELRAFGEANAPSGTPLGTDEELAATVRALDRNGNGVLEIGELFP